MDCGDCAVGGRDGEGDVLWSSGWEEMRIFVCLLEELKGV